VKVLSRSGEGNISCPLQFLTVCNSPNDAYALPVSQILFTPDSSISAGSNKECARTTRPGKRYFGVCMTKSALFLLVSALMGTALNAAEPLAGSSLVVERFAGAQLPSMDSGSFGLAMIQPGPRQL
jgi:hypothetical protein